MSESTLDVDLRTRLYIDGDFVHAIEGSKFTVENPADETPIADLAEAKAADIDRAVQAARR